MLIAIGKQAGLNWDDTARFVKDHVEELLRDHITWLNGWGVEGTGNFDARNGQTWQRFRCLDCTRILPVDCADLDHIAPKARLGFTGVQADHLAHHMGSKTEGWASPPPFIQWSVAQRGAIGVISRETRRLTVHPFERKGTDIVVTRAPYSDNRPAELVQRGAAAAPAPPAPGAPPPAPPAPVFPPPPAAGPSAARFHPGVAPPPKSGGRTHRSAAIRTQQAARPVWTFDILTVLKNNLENLMLLCPHCNRSKSDHI